MHAHQRIGEFSSKICHTFTVPGLLLQSTASETQPCPTSSRSRPRSATTRPSAPPAAASSCLRRSLGTAQLFSGQATGLIVRLPDWAYPVVIDTTTGQVHYDNYNGAWGDQAQLDRFLQIYAVEKARIEARKKGHQVTEQTLADGSIKLTIRVGGGS